MFGRSRTPAATPAASAPTGGSDDPGAAGDAARPGGKGRPTPKRREAQARNRRSVIGAPVLPPDATKEQRKAARQAAREQAARERAGAREALMRGDESALPARDRGPARRWARDYVDARWSVGEIFLPVALLSLVMMAFPVPVLRYASTALAYGVFLLAFVDSMRVHLTVKRETTARFGAKDARGCGMYAVTRGLMMRRGRLPKPQVARGQFPG